MPKRKSAKPPAQRPPIDPEHAAIWADVLRDLGLDTPEGRAAHDERERLHAEAVAAMAEGRLLHVCTPLESLRDRIAATGATRHMVQRIGKYTDDWLRDWLRDLDRRAAEVSSPRDRPPPVPTVPCAESDLLRYLDGLAAWAEQHAGQSARLSRRACRVLAVLQSVTSPLTQNEIGDRTDPQVDRQTVGRALAELRGRRLSEPVPGGGEVLTPTGRSWDGEQT